MYLEFCGDVLVTAQTLFVCLLPLLDEPEIKVQNLVLVYGWVCSELDKKAWFYEAGTDKINQ